MSNSHVNGAVSESSTIAKDLTLVKFDAAAVTAFWQSSAARLMRSSEVFMRGMGHVARLETELGQQLLQRGMAGLKTPAFGGELQARAREQSSHVTQEFESLIVSLRKIADESRNTCSDATLALFEAASPAVPPAPPAAPHIDAPVIKPKPNAATAAAARAAE